MYQNFTLNSKKYSTNENDLILDFFAGSGTTLAVAHKMKRRWIGIEQMNYVENITKERLKKVIAGEQGGISKALNFTGGGAFVYLELMPLNAVYKEKILQVGSDTSTQNSEANKINPHEVRTLKGVGGERLDFAIRKNPCIQAPSPLAEKATSDSKNLAESRRSERVENAKSQKESAESTKDSNIVDCHANPCGLSRNDGESVDCLVPNGLRNDEMNAESVRDSSDLSQIDNSLDEIYKDLQEKAFVDYRVDIQAMLKDKDFHALSVEEKKAILYSILDSNMDYVLYDDIEDSEYKIDKDLIALNKAFYGANDE